MCSRPVCTSRNMELENLQISQCCFCGRQDAGRLRTALSCCWLRWWLSHITWSRLSLIQADRREAQTHSTRAHAIPTRVLSHSSFSLPNTSLSFFYPSRSCFLCVFFRCASSAAEIPGNTKRISEQGEAVTRYLRQTNFPYPLSHFRSATTGLAHKMEEK